MADELDLPHSEPAISGTRSTCDFYDGMRGKRALRGLGDLIVGLIFITILSFAVYFSEVDSDYAGSRRITTGVQHALGIQHRTPLHAAAHAVAGAQGGILVAVKDDGLRLIAKTTLEHYGYTVMLADNPQEAVSMFRDPAYRVALVLVESSADADASRKTVQQFKKIRPKVPILRCSVRAGAIQENFGARDRIDQPLTAPILAAAVRNALSGK